MAGRNFDVCVVGAGAFGAWAALALAEAGREVLLLDSYGAANSRASSGGESRVISPTSTSARSTTTRAASPRPPRAGPTATATRSSATPPGGLRPFKGKGINTAVVTGIAAAEAMLAHGVSRAAFAEYRKACADLLGDYVYGVWVRRLMLAGARTFLDPLIDVGKTDPVMYDALFDSVSGHASYRDIIRRLLRARLARKVLTRAFRGIGRHRARRARRMTDVTVRKMDELDIDAVQGINERITGRAPAAYYASKCAEYVARSPDTCLVAEHGGRVVGFALGDMRRGWEFAQKLAGWLEVLVVDPGYRNRGVRRALLDSLFDSFRRAGVSAVNTVVDCNAADLVHYFRANGFERGDLVILVRRIDEEGGAAS